MKISIILKKLNTAINEEINKIEQTINSTLISESLLFETIQKIKLNKGKKTERKYISFNLSFY